MSKEPSKSAHTAEQEQSARAKPGAETGTRAKHGTESEEQPINTAAAVTHAAGPFRLKLDGVVKTISGNITGRRLHELAGCPKVLKSHGKNVPNNDEPFEMAVDQEFTTK